MIATVGERKRKWISHILRGDSFLRIVIKGRVKMRRTRGRPRQMLLYTTTRLNKNLRTETSGVIGRLNLPLDREPKE